MFEPAPLGTPDAIVRRVNADLIKALSDPQVEKRLSQLGRDHLAMTPEETLAFIQGEQQKWAPILAHVDVTR